METQLIPQPDSGQPDPRAHERGALLWHPGRNTHMGPRRHGSLPRTGPRTPGSWRASAWPICFVTISKHSWQDRPYGRTKCLPSWQPGPAPHVCRQTMGPQTWGPRGAVQTPPNRRWPAKPVKFKEWRSHTQPGKWVKATGQPLCLPLLRAGLRCLGPSPPAHTGPRPQAGPTPRL